MCECGKEVHSKGLCRSCYAKQYRAKQKEERQAWWREHHKTDCKCGEMAVARGMCRRCYTKKYSVERKRNDSRTCVEHGTKIARTNYHSRKKYALPSFICPDGRKTPCRLDCTLFGKLSPEDIRPLAIEYSDKESVAEFMKFYKNQQKALARDIYKHSKTADMPPCYDCYQENVLYCADHDFSCQKFDNYVSLGGKV
jgi:hypothetical protein